MTSTSFNVGLGDASRSSSKVLKPPGGGSSDIFGAGEAQQSPRKVKQYMASNISLTDGAPAPSGPGSTSSAASTASSGETPSPGSPTGTPTRNGTTATVEAQGQAQGEAQVIGQAQAQDQVAAAGKAPDGEPRGRQFQMQSHFSLGYDSLEGGAPYAAAAPEPPAAQDGNPVTGEGYNKPAPGGAPLRNRVPPGGYSSGLW